MVAQRHRTVGTEVVEARKEELKEARKEWKCEKKVGKRMVGQHAP